MVTEVSPKTKETATQELERLKAEINKLRQNQKYIEITQAYVYLKKNSDSDSKQVLVKLLLVDPRTEFPVKDPAKQFQGNDGKTHNEYKVAKWLHADESEFYRLFTGETKQVRLYFTKKA